jgi:hypothetical protein
MSAGFVPDGSLYPDCPPPVSFGTLEAKVDFIARLCGSWDFGVLPEAGTVREIRGPHWREAIDTCRLLTSPSYHLLRRWHRLPEAPFLGQSPAYIVNDPQFEHV